MPTAGFVELRRLLDAGTVPLEPAAEASRAIARWSAVLATSLTEFARYRPAGRFDRQPGERGAMSAATRAARPAALAEVSEWAVDEVAPTLRISGPAATAQLSESIVLTERLPRTLDLLARGWLTPAHARQMVTILGPVADDAVRADIEAHVLGLLGDKTPPQLGDCARRIVLRKDAEAAGRKLVAAIRDRGVRLHDRRDGTGTLVVDLPLPTAAAIYRHLETYADQTRVDGDERTKQQRMADCLTDLVLRAGEHGMPPVTIALTLVATLETVLGGNEPGQVDGHLVALTDATGIRRGEALGPPAATDEHDPGAELDRFVRLRDRRCRFPGCRARARSCDLDHQREWPHGPTAHRNLCCLCEHHHRLEHQAPGWRFDEADDGALAVTMPNGEVRVSSPPRFGTDLDVPPPF